MLTRAARLIVFARYIPARQIVRRAALRLRRAAERRLQPALAGPLARLADRAPQRLFAARSKAAERLSDGWRFTFLNRSERCGPAIDWRLGGEGAEHQLWRMNLHYFEWLPALNDEAMVEAIDQWIAAYPPFAPGAHQDGWNAYALSLRLVSWLSELAARRQRLDPRWIDGTVAAIARQLRYLERHIESDIGGNHLIKNIRALLFGSAAIASTDAKRWRQTGLTLLRRELSQVLADGMHFECSVSYHDQILGDLLDIRHALGGDPLGGALDAAIDRAAQVAADLSHPDGGPALFGDAGLTMAPAPALLREAARGISGHGYAPRPAFDLAQSGYAGRRHREDTFIIDAGALGPDTLPGHAHGDIGSFEWTVAGERLIVDQGVFTYVAGARRQQSRSAWSHNSLAAPQADQGEFFGAFRLGRRCRIAERSVQLNEDRLIVTVGHDGFTGPRGGARHRRRIEAHDEGIVIDDELDRPLPDAAMSLLIAPGIEVRETSEGIQLEGKNCECRIVSEGKATIETAYWWPDMGVELPTSRIRIAMTGLHHRTVLSVMARKKFDEAD